MQKLPVNTLAMGPMIQAFGDGIAVAQRHLDFVSLRLARAMAGLDPVEVSATVSVAGAGAAPEEIAFEPAIFPSGRRYSLLELGLTPSFYRFTEAVIEIKVAMSISLEEAIALPSKPKQGVKFRKGAVKVSSVNGQYASRYQYSGDSSSRIRSKIVSMPAPSLLEERVAAMQAQRRPSDQSG